MRIFVWPARAYVPGVTKRHPDGLFDNLCATAEPGMTNQELADSDAWSSAHGYFQAGYFWEARQVWRAVCAYIPPQSEDWLVGQAAIQLADAGLHVRMGKAQEALALCDQVEAYMLGLRGVIMNLSANWFAEQIALVREEAKESFTD
ncbi:MAG: hypothetical protein AAF393_08895 [Pseudomonadota bacterium]